MTSRAAFAAYGEHVNPSLAHFLELSGRDQRFVRASGCELVTDEGARYQDWVAGFGSLALGHNPPAILARLRTHLESGAPGILPESLNPFAGELAARLVTAAGGDFETCFLSNSGTEAIEAALKLAVAATGRRPILYARGGYHGTTLGSLSMMAAGEYRAPWEPLLPDFHPVSFDDLEALDAALTEHRPAAFVTEPVQVEAGVRSPRPGYLKAAAELCRRHGVLLILDEVQTGLGRTGAMFAFQRERATPDIVALAKALGAGLVPVGATLARAGLFEAAYGDPRRAELHNSTYGGNALACVTGLAVLDALEAPGFLEGVRATAAHLEEQTREALGEHPLVRRLTIHGLFGGLELEDPGHPWLTWEGLGVEGFDDLPVSGALLLHRMHRRGFLIQICGHSWCTVRLQPPLTVTTEGCDALVQALREELDWLKEAGE